MKNSKQAVLLIHGIGEQRPMETLRKFVDAVWVNDDSVHHKYGDDDVWSKPDTISGSFELRRLTTGKNANGVRTDFFEFYWAHLMEGTSVSHVIAWAKILLLRWPWQIPAALRGAWAVLVTLVLLVGFLLAQTVLPESYRLLEFPKWLTGVGSVALAWIAAPVIKNIIGDAARYLNAAPSNINRRQTIRAKGVGLLQKLHEAGYDRIVVVGHSLGSVIGYDILTYAWALHNESNRRKRTVINLDEIEIDVSAGIKTGAKTYQSKQRELLKELVQDGLTWRVTDFVSLGSPLTHAEILLAEDDDELHTRQSDREFPTCPPQLEKEKFSFPDNRVRRNLHHGAVFGPTRWSNLYFPARYLVKGDLIGGPMAEVFGGGIKDYSVSTTQRFGFLSHTLYWDGDSAASHIAVLRKAINLLDRPFSL